MNKDAKPWIWGYSVPANESDPRIRVPGDPGCKAIFRELIGDNRSVVIFFDNSPVVKTIISEGIERNIATLKRVKELRVKYE